MKVTVRTPLQCNINTKALNHLECLLCFLVSVMKETQGFYNSKAWQDCREAFRKSRKGLCEECLKNGIVTAGDMVHHKIHLSPDNMRNPDIALNFDNLELLCRTHHSERHGSSKRYKVDELGRVSIK